MRSFLQLARRHLFLKAVVGHAYDMACPLLLVPSDGCGDDWDLADTSLVVLLQDFQMYAVGGPAIQPHGAKWAELLLGKPVVVFEHSLPQQSQSWLTLCGGESLRQ